MEAQEAQYTPVPESESSSSPSERVCGYAGYSKTKIRTDIKVNEVEEENVVLILLYLRAEQRKGRKRSTVREASRSTARRPEYRALVRLRT